MSRNYFLGFLMTSLFTLLAGAADFKGANFQAIIKKPDGTYPTIASVSVLVKVLSVNDCVLSEERFTNVSITNGYIYLVVGKGTPTGADPGRTMKQIMNNAIPFAGITCLAPDGSVDSAVTTYTPQDRDSRRIRISLTIDGDLVVADFNMRSVAFAVNSETLNGKVETDFIHVNSSSSITQSKLEQFFQTITLASGNAIRWDGTNFTAYDPTSGVGFQNDTIAGTAVTSLPWSKITSAPAPLVEIGGLSCVDTKILIKTGGVWTCGDNAAWGGVSGGDVYRVTGNVGIGTATPTEKLEVSGTIKSSNLWPILSTTDPTNVNVNQWTKIATVRSDVRYDTASAFVDIGSGFSWAPDTGGGTIYFKIKQQNTYPNNPLVELYVLNAFGRFTASDLMAVITISPTNSVTDIYIRPELEWHIFNIQPRNVQLIGTPNAVTFYGNQPFLASLPTGNQKAFRMAGFGSSGSFVNLSPESIYYTGGSVGIGTATPQATLDVDGYMRLKNNTAAPVACSATNDGAIARTSKYTLCICKGGTTQWLHVADGTTVCSWM
jgi:hypothetical protein